jgi:hypothetical protein
MTTLECRDCGKKRILDEEDEDEVHNAVMEGWEFAINLDSRVLCPICGKCPVCNDKEFMERL